MNIETLTHKISSIMGAIDLLAELTDDPTQKSGLIAISNSLYETRGAIMTEGLTNETKD